VPLHVWLPDAMEGPTPVSALIHAATMVAAGVFLVARVYPLMTTGEPMAGGVLPGETGALQVEAVHHAITPALKVVTWIGVITAFFAASIAVAQNDIKRILAYSTVSQLGFMMMGLGVGGVAVGMFHLITHAFFKALLFLGAGSVIHGLHEEQDIRRMGGLRGRMPVTFAVYAAGMLALSGFPLLFSGFWSKDTILHAAHGWQASHLPFYLAIATAFLTAFYMMRQVVYVFFGQPRPNSPSAHESPAVMLLPMVVLAIFAVLLGFIGTPAWPWFQGFMEGRSAGVDFGQLTGRETLSTILLSSVIALAGLALGWWMYGGKASRTRRGAGQQETSAAPLEWLETRWPETYQLLSQKYYVDEIYEASVVRFARWISTASDWLDRTILDGLVRLVSSAGVGLSWLSKAGDDFVVNAGFDAGCEGLAQGGGWFSRWQTGRVQSALRIVFVSVVVLLLLVIWGLQTS
jgi:NADH-quinone oxidoreductase subunit L